MRFGDYLRDRIAWLALYFAGGGLAVMVMQLDRRQPRTPANSGTIAYIFLLLGVLLAVFVAWDFSRQARFYRTLALLTGPDAKFEDAAAPRGAATREQALFSEAIAAGFRQYQDRIEGYRRREELHQRFSDRWAHFMKTPVSVIKLLVKQGQEAQTLPEAGEALESIGEEDDRLLHGLEMFLSSARLDRFEIDVRVERVDILEIARDVLNAHKKEFIRSSIYPKVESSTDQVFVATDPKWIRFVLEQLVTNAIKYTRAAHTEGSKSLTVSAAGGTGSSSTGAPAGGAASACVLTVKDEGIGIPPEDLPRVFDPFFTGKNGRLVAESTGMGLYLVREILGRLGHQARVESQVGQGTSVSVVFSSGSITEGILSPARPS